MADTERADAAPTANKRKLSRNTLSLREKAIVKSFCEQKVTESKARGSMVPSQELLRQEVASRFGWNCGRSTLSKILSMDWKLLRGEQEGGEAPRNTNMKRRRRPLFPALETDLVKFIDTYLKDKGTVVDADGSSSAGSVDGNAVPSGEQHSRPLTEAMILEEAQRLKQVHGISDKELVLSVGWLARFKHRNGIRMRRTDNNAKMYQPLEVVTTDTTTGAWSENLMDTTNSTQTEETAHYHTAAHATIVTESASTRETVPVDLGSMVVTSARAAQCSAQWNPAKLTKSSPLATSILSKVPERIRALSCSCQASAMDRDLAEGITGLHVAVVGFDGVVKAFLAAALVGASGFVTCVEGNRASVWAAEQAAENYCLVTLGLPLVNMRFIVGEFGGVSCATPRNSSDERRLQSIQGQVDMVICNCSIQSLEFPSGKSAVLELAYSLLKVGGELRLTELVCSRRLSASESEDARTAAASESSGAVGTKQLEQQLLLGAPYVGDLRRLFRTLSSDVDIRSISCTKAEDEAIGAAVASLLPSIAETCEVRFRWATFHLFRLQDAEEPREDYGQTAVFNGVQERMAGKDSMSSFTLDDDFIFQKGEYVPVDGNTAQILETSWLRHFFTVNGDRSRHRGPFLPSNPHTAENTSTTSKSEAINVEANGNQVAAPDSLEMADI